MTIGLLNSWKLNFSIFRAGLLICCYLMDRRELDIEEAIAVFNKLAGPQPDSTKDLFRSLGFTSDGKSFSL